ncbi:MAG: hypothetical protein C4523_08440 [Myxococcales bacterium]|nr:MAG: hypothetical protein C4523_08440 [Myxococcales bacterium]
MPIRRALLMVSAALLGGVACDEQSGDDLAFCLADCGDLATVTVNSPCGEDGYLYADLCEMTCLEVKASENGEPCLWREDRECNEVTRGRAILDAEGCNVCVCQEDREWSCGRKTCPE